VVAKLAAKLVATSPESQRVAVVVEEEAARNMAAGSNVRVQRI